MKKLLYLICLLPFASFGQNCQIVKFGDTRTIDSFIATVKPKQLVLPDTFYATECRNPRNSIALVGGALWTNNGTIWVQQTGGGFDSTYIYRALADTAAILNDRIDSVAALAAPLDTTTIYKSIADSVALRELLSNKVTSFASPNNTTYPTTAAVNGVLSNYVTNGKLSDSLKTKLPFIDTTGEQGKILTVGAGSIYWGALSVVGSLQSSDNSLVVTPPSGAVDATLNMAHPNTWTRLQTFDSIALNTATARTSAGLSLRSSSGSAIISMGAGGGQNITFAGYTTTNTGDSVLSTNSSGGLINYNIAGTYKKIADTTGAGGYVTKGTAQKTADSISAIVATKGTVTAVNAGYAITGGNITTSGTHGVDSGAVATRLRVQKAIDSLNIVKGNGTVTQVNTGYGITTTTITTTGTITVDTFAMSTKANRLKGNDSVIAYTNSAITAERSATATLTNKRITYRVTSAANYTTSVTIDADNYDVFEDSLQAGALLFNAPSGTPTNYQLLEVAIRDNGTARALTYNAIFAASTDLSLPTTTTISKWLFMLFQYNSRTAKWYLIAKLDNL